jgi:DNA primase
VAELALPHLQPGRSICFVTLANGSDPDSIFKTGGAEAVAAAIAKPTALSEYLWQSALSSFGFGTPAFTPERRAAMEKQLDEWCNNINDGKVKASYRDFFFKRRREIYSGKSATKPASVGGTRNSAAEIECLALILNHPEILAHSGNEERFAAFEFNAPEHRTMQQAIVDILPALENISAYNLENIMNEQTRQIATKVRNDPLAKMSAAIAPTAPEELVKKAWRQCLQRMSHTEQKLDPSNMTDEAWQAYVNSRTGEV